MLTGYPLSCTLGRSVLGIGSGVARFLMTAKYATYRYLRCVVNVKICVSNALSACSSVDLNLSGDQRRFDYNNSTDYGYNYTPM